MFFDAEIEDGRRDVDDANLAESSGEAGACPLELQFHTSGGSRVPMSVKAECRDEAENRAWDGRSADYEIVVLGGPLPLSEPILTRTEPLQRTRSGHPGKRAGVDAKIGNIACAEDWPRPSNVQQPLGISSHAAFCWQSLISVNILPHH